MNCFWLISIKVISTLRQDYCWSNYKIINLKGIIQKNKVMTRKFFALSLVLTLFLSAAIAQSETEAKVDGAEIVFAEGSKNFGDITQGDVVEHTFKFENVGTQPLIISNVLVTCGCTATDWPREPIAAGKSSEITVKFDSKGKNGAQNKIITVVSNAVNPREKVSIKTNVLPKKKDDA